MTCEDDSIGIVTHMFDSSVQPLSSGDIKWRGGPGAVPSPFRRYLCLTFLSHLARPPLTWIVRGWGQQSVPEESNSAAYRDKRDSMMTTHLRSPVALIEDESPSHLSRVSSIHICRE